MKREATEPIGFEVTRDSKTLPFDLDAKPDRSISMIVWQGEEDGNLFNDSGSIRWELFQKPSRLFEDVIALNYDKYELKTVEIKAIPDYKFNPNDILPEANRMLDKANMNLVPRLEYEKFRSTPDLMHIFEEFLINLQLQTTRMSSFPLIQPIPKDLLNIFEKLEQIVIKNLAEYIDQKRQDDKSWFDTCLSITRLRTYIALFWRINNPCLGAMSLVMSIELAIRISTGCRRSIAYLMVIMKEVNDSGASLDYFDDFIKGMDCEDLSHYKISCLDLVSMPESRGRLYNKLKLVLGDSRLQANLRMVRAALMAKLTLGGYLYRRCHSILRTLRFVVLCQRLNSMQHRGDLEMQAIGLASWLDSDLFFGRYYLEHQSMTLDALLELVRVQTIAGKVSSEKIVHVFSDNIHRLMNKADGLKVSKMFKGKYMKLVDDMLKSLNEVSEDRRDEYRGTLLMILIEYYKNGLLTLRDGFLTIGSSAYSILARIVSPDNITESLSKVVVNFFELECLATGFLFQRTSTEDSLLIQYIAHSCLVDEYDRAKISQILVNVPSCVPQNYSNGEKAELKDVISKYFHFEELIKLLEVRFPIFEILQVIRGLQGVHAITYAAKGLTNYLHRRLKNNSEEDFDLVVALSYISYKTPEIPDLDDYFDREQEYDSSMKQISELIKEAAMSAYQTNITTLEMFLDRLTDNLKRSINAGENLDTIREVRQAQVQVAEICAWVLDSELARKTGKDFKFDRYIIKPEFTRSDIILNYYLYHRLATLLPNLSEKPFQHFIDLSIKSRILLSTRFLPLPPSSPLAQGHALLRHIHYGIDPLHAIMPHISHDDRLTLTHAMRGLMAVVCHDHDRLSFMHHYDLWTGGLCATDVRCCVGDVVFEKYCDVAMVAIDKSALSVVTVSLQSYRSVKFEEMCKWKKELTQSMINILMSPVYIVKLKQPHQVLILKESLTTRLLNGYLTRLTERFPMRYGLKEASEFIAAIYGKLFLKRSSSSAPSVTDLSEFENELLYLIISNLKNWPLPDSDLTLAPTNLPESFLLLAHSAYEKLAIHFGLQPPPASSRPSFDHIGQALGIALCRQQSHESQY